MGAMLEMAEVVASRPIIHTLDSVFPQVDGFTPHADFLYSPYSRENALGRPFSGVVATCPESRTGYHPFPQVDGFTPHTGGIYSPSLATTLVATFWLPTGYHPKTGFRGVNPDVAARASTCWTREHRLEMWELLSGNKRIPFLPSPACPCGCSDSFL